MLSALRCLESGTGGGDSPRSVVISPGQGIARYEPQLSSQGWWFVHDADLGRFPQSCSAARTGGGYPITQWFLLAAATILAVLCLGAVFVHELNDPR